MRWGYKTIHFSMKKDGILGNAFLDETEIEVTLNEYGKSGWELISFMEVSDGLIAVFKQPFDYGLPDFTEEKQIQEEVPAEERIVQEIETVAVQETEKFPVDHMQHEEEQASPVEEEKINRGEGIDVGSIRIG